LAASLLAALGRGEDATAKSRSHRCLPAGRRCGTKKTDRSCRRCCQGTFIITPTGRKKCACKSDGTACENPSQCCSGLCQDDVCRATTQGTPLSEVGNGIVTPAADDCNPSLTACQQVLSGVITSGSPIAAGTFAGTITVRNFEPFGEGAAGDVSGPLTLTENGTGAELSVLISGRVSVSFLTGVFTFSGGYTITGGTGRFAGATGAGSATFSGSSDPVTGATTITTLTLSGLLLL
jgi:hypothetical protein